MGGGLAQKMFVRRRNITRDIAMRKSILIFLLTGYFVATGYGQKTGTTGWFFLSNTHKFAKRFDILTDLQLRSADRFSYLNTVLLRAAINYHLREQHAVALGYTYKGDWERDEEGRTFSPEHRVYEQYLYDFKLGKTEMTIRARVEQRFVKGDETFEFSQRARAFISAQIPLITDKGFTKGLYAGLQNELFCNVQHKSRVNGNFFDQNRSLVSLGYRFNKIIDAEIGYMYWYQEEAQGINRTNVLQVMFTTKF